MLILIAVSAATLYFGQFYLWTAQLSDDTNDKLGPAIEFRKNAFCMSHCLFAIRADIIILTIGFYLPRFI